VSSNTYSAQWQATFAQNVSPERSEQEVAFLTRVLPLPEFARVLDAPCGFGRHAQRLARLGYSVTGVDRDETVLAEARRRAPEVEFRALDIRHLRSLDREFDAAICMWQSFGWFDEDENRDVLVATAERLRPHGRLVIDSFDRRFFETHPEPRVYQGNVQERRSIVDGRLRVHLRYPNGATDDFDFQLFRPAELAEFARRAGFELVLSCAEFDEALEANAAAARFQLVLERRP
jgi:SAM-dependent methyltransferase